MLDTFKEISIGGLEKGALIQRLIDADTQFNEYAKTLFNHRAFSPGRQIERVNLVKVKLSDLNLNSPCSYQLIIARASSLCLRLCPLYLAAFLRLEYLHQPEGPYLTIASPESKDGEGYPTGFYVRNFNGSLWLRGYRADGDAEWPPDNEFVFLEVKDRVTRLFS